MYAALKNTADNKDLCQLSETTLSKLPFRS